jgi:gliding motility-associated lipoprotein GldH
MKKVIFILILFSIYSCDNSNYLFRESVSFKNEIWTVSEKIPFQFSVSDTLKKYKIGFDIHYTDAYSQQNMYVFLHTIFPNGMRMHDTIPIDLFSLEGKPLGKGSKIIKLQRYFSRVQFPITGQYTMVLEQAMRTDTLSGIVSMGLCISE